MWWLVALLGIGIGAVIVWLIRVSRENERERREADARRVRFSRAPGQGLRHEPSATSLRHPRDAA